MYQRNNITVRRPTMDDLRLVLSDIREADKLEWYRGLGMRDFELAVRPALSSPESRVALIDNTPALFWGHVGVQGWMFATNTAAKYAVLLHRELLHEVDALVKQLGLLVAVCDSENTKHLRWLRWLGFAQIAESIPHGVLQAPFIVFVKEDS